MYSYNPQLLLKLFAREKVAFCTKQEIASISITWNRGKSDIHTYIHLKNKAGTQAGHVVTKNSGVTCVTIKHRLESS